MQHCCRVVLTNLLLKTFYLIYTNCATLQMSVLCADLDASIRDVYNNCDVSLVDTTETLQSKESVDAKMSLLFTFIIQIMRKNMIKQVFPIKSNFTTKS